MKTLLEEIRFLEHALDMLRDTLATGEDNSILVIDEMLIQHRSRKLLETLSLYLEAKNAWEER